MKPSIDSIEEAVFAGVLGKTIGVYLGRPVEGWTYQRIKNTFGDIKSYVHSQVGSKIVEVDDDLSGTFTFVNVLKDSNYETLTCKDIGDYWLNEIIENKTIFWWGGYYRSTEHTAYLNLKNGIHAPDSGSSKYNGKVCAEQIGAQIFIDGWGLIHLGYPENAKRNALMAAHVSHDGIATQMAAFIATLEAVVFSEKNIVNALNKTCDIIRDDDVSNYVHEMMDVCNKYTSWRDVRDYIASNHNYEKYKGNCPVVTNFLAIIMALLMNKDDFLNAISIATSCGWDTDCNAGNVGCIEGIRLGLDSIYKYPQLKSEFNEKVYVVNAESGYVNQDVTSIANNLLNIRNTIYHDCASQDKKYSFDFYGSTNGFYSDDSNCIGSKIESTHLGLLVKLSPKGSVKREVYYYDKSQELNGYDLIQSPSVFPGQTIEAKLIIPKGNIMGRFFIEIVNGEEKIEKIKSDLLIFESEQNYQWRIPEARGYPIITIGIEFENVHKEEIIIQYMNTFGNPAIHYETTFAMSPEYLTGHVAPTWYKAFTSTSNENTVDHLSTFCISSTQDNGLLYIGNRDWKNYTITTTLILVRSKNCGILFRVQGLRKYYALLFEEYCVKIIRVINDEIKVMASHEYIWNEYDEIKTKITIKNDDIQVQWESEKMECKDSELMCGGCGFITSAGTMMVKGLEVIGE